MKKFSKIFESDNPTSANWGNDDFIGKHMEDYVQELKDDGYAVRVDSTNFPNFRVYIEKAFTEDGIRTISDFFSMFESLISRVESHGYRWWVNNKESDGVKIDNFLFDNGSQKNSYRIAYCIGFIKIRK